MSKAEVGLMGLGVMGKSLVLNLLSKEFRVSIYNRNPDKVKSFMGQHAHKNVVPAYNLEEFLSSLEKPRKILLMIKAGKPVDEWIEKLCPLLDPEDIIIDAGNSLFTDTNRRCKLVEERGFYYVGMGVSGGEEGALKGPSMMPGGNEKVKNSLMPIFTKIAAQTKKGEACCRWIGSEGSGHFVKMVHNGIEYGDMQLICEVYHLMRQTMSTSQMAEVFSRWNQGNLGSYLIEITADIFKQNDPETGNPMVDMILDRAGQKGTGGWTVQAALNLGISIPTITEAVFARCISSQKKQRVSASSLYPIPEGKEEISQEFIDDLEKALYAAKICSYAQGFDLIREASEEYAWNLCLSDIACIWKKGCIIRAKLLESIEKSFGENKVSHLLQDPYFVKVLLESHESLRKVVCRGTMQNIPIPALSSALSYFDSYRCANLPANLLQAQRDYFGAHTYERTDKSGVFHTQWTTEEK